MIKKNLGFIILIILLVSLDIYWKQIFYTAFLIYGLFIKFLLSDSVSGRFRKSLAIIIWATFSVILGLTFYVNHYLPHGSSYPTGEIVCRNDDRGPCGEQYKEDLRGVNIPSWAKFLRESEGDLLLFGLFFAGLVISSKDKIGKKIG
ncbi:MAG: hypothetical protein WC870_03305 [Candidatus Paceibacterota bacterium]